MSFKLKYFTQSQRDWIEDTSPLKIIQKSRQIGISHADDYHSVIIASRPGAKLDDFITSRDEVQAKLSLENCRDWAQLMSITSGDATVQHFQTSDLLPQVQAVLSHYERWVN